MPDDFLAQFSEALDAAEAAGEDHSLVYERSSISFDKFLSLESEALDALVGQIFKQIDTSETKGRKRSDAEQRQRNFLRVLLLNLNYIRQWPKRIFLALPMTAGEYTSKARYNNSELSYKPLKKVYDQLLEAGLLNVVMEGYFDKVSQTGATTRVEASPELNKLLAQAFPTPAFPTRSKAEEIIILKDISKRKIDYIDTDYTLAARNNLALINSVLNAHWYDLHISDNDFQTLANKLHSKGVIEEEQSLAAINLSVRRLYRVFNNGSKENPSQNFTHGGRFYGAWWESIPSEYRAFITINGQETFEVDYSGLHPNMLYAQNGIALAGDPYEVEGVRRKWSKYAFQQLLNGKRDKYSIPSDFNASAEGILWDGVREAVEKRNASIAQYFGTGYGLILQKQDADILEQVLLHFARQGEPCLPVHDSVIIRKELAEELREVMLFEYTKALGVDISLKLHEGKVLPSSQEALEGYSQYYERQKHWLATRSPFSVG